MDYKSVLEEQIRELQKLQDENVKRNGMTMSEKVGNAVLIAEEILKICVEAEKIAELKGSERQITINASINSAASVEEIAREITERLKNCSQLS